MSEGLKLTGRSKNSLFKLISRKIRLLDNAWWVLVFSGEISNLVFFIFGCKKTKITLHTVHCGKRLDHHKILFYLNPSVLFLFFNLFLMQALNQQRGFI